MGFKKGDTIAILLSDKTIAKGIIKKTGGNTLILFDTDKKIVREISWHAIESVIPWSIET